MRDTEGEIMLETTILVMLVLFPLFVLLITWLVVFKALGWIKNSIGRLFTLRG
jgi:hypothetical protein